MGELSTSAIERARKAISRVLSSMQEPGTQKNLAVSLGVSEATVSRIKTDHLEDVLVMVYQLGFKVVPSHAVTVDFSELQALKANTLKLYHYELKHGRLEGEEE